MASLSKPLGAKQKCVLRSLRLTVILALVFCFFFFLNLWWKGTSFKKAFAAIPLVNEPSATVALYADIAYRPYIINLQNTLLTLSFLKVIWKLLKMFSIFIYKIPDVGTNHVNLHLEIFWLATKMTRNHKHHLSVQIYNSFLSPPPPPSQLQKSPPTFTYKMSALYLKWQKLCLATLKSSTFPPNSVLQYHKRGKKN